MTASVWPVAPGSSWERVRDALEGRGLVTRARGDHHIDARCPAHDDGRASLTADYQAGEPGRVLIRCHAGCEFADVVAALGLREADTYDGPPPDGARRAPRLPRPARTPAPTSARVKCDHRWGDVEAYRYTDADGEIVCEVVRQACQECGGKNFPVRRPDGRGGWEWKWPAMAARPLYRLPAVLAAVAEGRTVYIAEGEKDVHALERAGLVATCNPGGAGKFRAEHAGQLAGAARVVIVADRDPAGYKHAAAVAGQLAAVTPPPAAVDVVEPAEGKDAADHLAAGHSTEEFAPVDPAARLAELERATVTPIASRLRPVAPVRDDAGPQDDGGDGGKPWTRAKWIAVEGSPGWEYRPPAGGDPGAVAQWTGRGEDRELTEVLSWAPDVLGQLVTQDDDGRATSRHYEIRVGEDTQIVSNADLRTGEAWDKFPDATGLGVKKTREIMHNVVSSHAARRERTLAATRTGWHGQDDSRFYLYPDGRTFPDNRRVRLIGAPAKLERAARPLGETASPDELLRALEDIAAHGGAFPMFSLATGARALAQSLVPVRAALALVGQQNSGKTSSAAHGRGLLLTSRPYPFPFVPTKNFGATRTDLEFAVNFEADMPQVIEDLALSGDAPPAEVRDAIGKLEALIRPVANDDEIRGRRTRDLMPGPANYVRSIPTVTAQQLPAGMQSSLYRRAVVLYLRDGDVDTTWYAPADTDGGGGGASLVVPLRTLGDLLIARLYEHGDGLEHVLNGYATQAYRMIAPAMDNTMPGWHSLGDGTTGIIRSAAGMLTGLALIAEVVKGADFAELAAPIIAPLAASLAEQSSKMADRQAAADSLADAVSRVVTSALLNRRAHVCGKDGRPAPLVPGLSPTEQGLRDIGGHLATEWEGSGVPLYWLDDRGGIGIRTDSLHALLHQAGESRGLTPRSLPPKLLQDGVSIRNDTQDGRAAVHEIRVGNGKPRLILLRPEIVTGELESKPVTLLRAIMPANGDNGDNGDSAGQEPENDGSPQDPPKNGDNAGQRPIETAEVAEVAEFAEPATREDTVVAVVAERRQTTATTPRSALVNDRFAAPAVVADADSAFLAVADRLEALELPELGGLADVLGWVKLLRLGVGHPAGMPDDPVGVIMPGLAARLGLPASVPDPKTKAAREHPALEALRAAGWEGSGELRSWMAFYRPGERGRVRLWLPHWDDFGECPMWGEETHPDAAELAWRLARFAAALGIGWRMTGGMTGADLARTFPRRPQRHTGKPMQLEPAEPPKPAFAPALEIEFLWSRKPLDSETAEGWWLHCYDGNGAYTAAYGQAAVNLGAWQHVTSPAFDRKIPGYWRIERPEWSAPLLPNPFDPTGREHRHGDSGPRWYATPTLAHAAELGYEVTPLEAYLPAEGASWGRWYEPWAERVRDARKALLEETDPDSAAVLAAVKHVWHQTHSAVGLKSQGHRRDHDHAIIATYRANLLRRLVKISDAEQRYPLAIATDNVAYVSRDPDPRKACPAGLPLGTGLGEFKIKGTLPMADAVPLLGTGRAADVIKLFDAAGAYLEENHDGA